jgi:primosomal replication protein N
MKNLNSILLEGALVSEPLFQPVSDTQVPRLRFLLDIDPTVPPVPVTISGHLATTCQARLHTGSAIRVVGRIGVDNATEAIASIVILPEHVEFKPQLYTLPLEETADAF